MKALTGFSQAQFDQLLPVFSDIDDATQQHTYEERVAAGLRRLWWALEVLYNLLTTLIIAPDPESVQSLP